VKSASADSGSGLRPPVSPVAVNEIKDPHAVPDASVTASTADARSPRFQPRFAWFGIFNLSLEYRHT
jgi:hypothetical protein